jgi:hypothetical protein
MERGAGHWNQCVRDSWMIIESAAYDSILKETESGYLHDAMCRVTATFIVVQRNQVAVKRQLNYHRYSSIACVG